MTISQMHEWFRQYAQQMGMQNVRAILPEQIDILINTAISDITNQVIAQNIAVTNDRIITDNSKINQINALSTLYKVAHINALPGTTSSATQPFKESTDTLTYKISAKLSTFKDDSSSAVLNYLYLVDLSLNYKINNKVTNYFPVRLIDDVFLADTLNDFILKPKLRSPIAVIYNGSLDIYITDNLVSGKLPDSITPGSLRLSYIAKPAKVQYKSDLAGTDVDCDLPEYLHIDVLKRAVDLYKISISGGLYSAQQASNTDNTNNTDNNK